GFKSSTVSFADVYASSRVGLGTQISAVNQDFSVGNLSVTGGQFDLAIDGASGMFRVVDNAGSVFFTRNGQFSPDKDGNLTNAQGQFLTGYVLNQATGAYSLTPERIQLPTGNIAPRATGANVLNDENSGGVARSMKLSATADEVAEPFPSLPADPDAPQVPSPSSYNMSVPMTVYDSLGREHQLTQYFAKTGENEWKVYYQLGSDVTADWQEFTVRFNPDGTIEKPTAADPTACTTLTTVTFAPAAAEPLEIGRAHV